MPTHFPKTKHRIKNCELNLAFPKKQKTIEFALSKKNYFMKHILTVFFLAIFTFVAFGQKTGKPTFDVADFKTPIELTWHDDKTFPISGMNQVKVTEKNDVAFEYDLNTVASGGLFGNLRINPAASCRTARHQAG